MALRAPQLGFERRALYENEHRLFRLSFRKFLEREVVPGYADWERAGEVPRSVYERAAQAGFSGMAVPEEFGGAGVEDFRFNAVISEETQRLGVTSFGIGLTNHTDVCLPYLLAYGSSEQQARWLPKTADGSAILAIALTEPGTGSDLSGISTSGTRASGGWIVNGSKTFITCGHLADLLVTAVRTDPDSRHGGLTLMVLERGMEGFTRGRYLEKIGLHGQDTAELFFKDVFVPDANVLGEPGTGFMKLVSNLPQERMTIAIAAQSASRAALIETLQYTSERNVFGKPLVDLQATRFTLADIATEVEVGQAFVDRCVQDLVAGELSAEVAAMAKLWCTETQGRVIDRCLQLHGGNGYMTEYTIAKRYADARVTRIYGGTSEIMKQIIGKGLTS